MPSNIIKEYDFIISLGRFCHTKELLLQHDLQIMDGPYDWSGTAHRATVYNRLKWFYKGFKHYFDKKDFVDFEPYKEELERFFCDPPHAQCKHVPEHTATILSHAKRLYNKRTHTYYTHDWLDTASFDDQFAAIKEKYMRRIKRTEHYIQQAILFCLYT